MAILASDIKLFESERMRDTPDGGGRKTGRVIPSGQAGNVFPKVSRADSVYGRVNLRKIYPAVDTATLDMYAGAHAIFIAPPANNRISCVLFSTGSSFDQRSAARNRIESYVVAGPLSRMRLYGDQLIGQKAITCYQRTTESLPEIGDVVVLSVEATGYTAAQQYVRVTGIEHEVRTFTDNSGEFERRVITMKIGSALVQTFPGAEVSRYSTDASPTKVRVTQVADASQYYGIQPLAEEGELGALALRLASIYAPLVPSTQRETAVSLASPAGVAPVVGAGAETSFAVAVASTTGSYPDTNIALRTPRPIAPASLTLTSADNRTRWVDNGDGSFNRYVDGALIQVHANQIDYTTGEFRIWIWEAATYTVRYRPGAVASGPAHTRDIPITLGTRGSVYVETLTPLPAPGTVIVDYRAQGRWYRLRDNGAGVLVANTQSEGTGSVDYATGALIITLGALPDVGSSVIIGWGSPVHYAVRAGATTDAGTTLNLAYTLQHAPVVPGSVTIGYPVSGANRTAADAAADGTISGTDVTGTINYATGQVELAFSTPPDRAANVSNAYTWRDGADLYSGTSAAISGGQFTVPGNAPFRNAGSMQFQVQNLAFASAATLTVTAFIKAGGAVVVAAGQDGKVKWKSQTVGTFDAVSGVVTLTAGVLLKWNAPILVGANFSGWSPSTAAGTILSVSGIAVERDTAAFDPQAVTGEQVSASAIGLTLDLTTTIGDAVVAGSVLFTATGKSYLDRSGTLYADVSVTTGSGIQAGRINYDTGLATLTWWADGAAVARTVDACLTIYGVWTAVDTYFRTAGSPVRPASLYVQVTAADGELLTATSDQNGVVTGPSIRGTVEQEMGVVRLEFGEQVGVDWQPRQVAPGTLAYNTVVLTHLPLDANILGLDPVRLPADGRVPIYRAGGLVVVHHTDRTELANPVAAGQSYSVGRDDLAVLYLEDANGAPLADDRYVADPAAGTVTISADWSGAGVAQPLTAVHRIEHMSLLSDVQVNGQIELTVALPRAFPAGSYVSSALLHGDLQAIVTNLFDQQSWTGLWSDALIGSQANAQFDDINYPVEVLNESAVTERWRINFTSTTAFALIGENLGQIATGSVGADLAPINPVTGDPYFVLRAAGWGGGWASGNQLRFNTVGATGPTWIARTVLAGASLEGDEFWIEERGDVD